jgi:hypothetical protein
VSHTPNPLESAGIDERVKITAAQTTTGSQTMRTRDRAIATRC